MVTVRVTFDAAAHRVTDRVSERVAQHVADHCSAQHVAISIADGVTGVFSKPIKGARKEGLGGFFKGVGQGLAGVVVKPIVGVTSAAVSVVQGASNATDDSEVHTHVRLRRALPIHAYTGGSSAGMAYITPYR